VRYRPGSIRAASAVETSERVSAMRTAPLGGAGKEPCAAAGRHAAEAPLGCTGVDLEPPVPLEGHEQLGRLILEVLDSLPHGLAQRKWTELVGARPHGFPEGQALLLAELESLVSEQVLRLRGGLDGIDLSKGVHEESGERIAHLECADERPPRVHAASRDEVLGFALLGSGNGVLTSALLMRIRRFDLPTALGHYYALAALWCALAAGVYFARGAFDWRLALPATLGALAGGTLGARIGRKAGSRLIRPLFVVIGLALAVRLLW